MSLLQRVTGRGLVSVVAALGFGLFSVGCQTVPKEEYDEAITENNELRDRVTALQDSVKQAEADKETLQRRADELSSEIERTRAGGPGATGGIDGVSTSIGTRGDVVLQVAGDVLFSSGQATVKQSGQATLNRIAQTIKQNYSGNTIRVEGYTDTDPIRKSKWESNEHLSAARAIAVEKYLVSRGVSANQIYAAAMGSAKPRGTKEQSRRVEIVILAN